MPSDAGVQSSLDQLISSFQSLASNPVDPAARAVVVASTVELTDKLRSIDTRLQAVAADIDAQLQDSVREANSAITEISALNTQIRAAGGKAPDLLDRRDALLDKLSGLVSVRVVDQPFGAVDALVGAMQVVTSGGGTRTLSVTGTGPYMLQLGNPPTPASEVQGKVRGLLDAFNTIGTRGTPTARATGLRGQLDDFAAGLVTAVNEIHSGYNPATTLLQPTITPAPSPLQTGGRVFRSERDHRRDDLTRCFDSRRCKQHRGRVQYGRRRQHYRAPPRRTLYSDGPRTRQLGRHADFPRDDCRAGGRARRLDYYTGSRASAWQREMPIPAPRPSRSLRTTSTASARK